MCLTVTLLKVDAQKVQDQMILPFEEKAVSVLEEGYSLQEASSLPLSSARIREVKKAIIHQIKDGH